MKPFYSIDIQRQISFIHALISQMKHKLHEVFKTNGVPTVTYVEPYEFSLLQANLRVPGRGLVIEGPSGIGKTTAIKTALRARFGDDADTLVLSARNPKHISIIASLPTETPEGIRVIDDFHRLDPKIRQQIADYLKLLADTEDANRKIVIIGINKAGCNLLHLAEDLVARIDIIKFDSNPKRKIMDLIEKGLKALNIQWNVTEQIAENVFGSFQIAQLACYEICVDMGVEETSESLQTFDFSFQQAKARLWARLDNRFRERCEMFCRGRAFKRGGRAPYLQVLYWLSTCNDWTLELRKAIESHPNSRSSVSLIVDRGWLEQVINEVDHLKDVLYYDKHSEQVTVEDPQFLFYIANIPWNHFAKKIGFPNVEFLRNYDFALSFAGQDRQLAKALFDCLSEEEFEVFYDHNESHRILAKDVEEYLLPIYQSEAHFIVVFLSRFYPDRIWTKMESDAFRERFKDGEVIPVWLSEPVDLPFSVSNRVGSFTIDKSKDVGGQIKNLCHELTKKMTLIRTTGE